MKPCFVLEDVYVGGQFFVLGHINATLEHLFASLCVCVCVCINQLSPPPSLPVVYGSPAGRHISLPFDGDTDDSWLLGGCLFSLRLVVSPP